MALLDIQNISLRFGGLRAIQDVSFQVGENEIVGLIGPNGAGKTTLFNILTAVYQPNEGSISLDGKNLNHLKPHQTVQIGLARTFQNIRIFKSMSALENIKVGYHHNGQYNMLEAMFRLPRYWKEEKEYTERAMKLLDSFQMAECASTEAGNLSYGQQRKLEICRALASSPRVLLLDEPAAGMNPTETAELMCTIRKIKDEFHTSVLLIEHDMKLVMGLCERLVVLNYGKVLANDVPEKVKTNPDVIRAYLGSEGDPNAS